MNYYPSPTLRQVTNRACYTAHWGAGGVLCVLVTSFLACMLVH